MVASLASSAQVRISGTVADSLDNTSLPGVNIILRNLRDTTQMRGTTTNANGAFEFNGVRPGRYLMKLSYTGYTIRTRRVFIRAADVDLGTLTLGQSVTTLKSVEIQGTAVPARSTSGFSPGMHIIVRTSHCLLGN